MIVNKDHNTIDNVVGFGNVTVKVEVDRYEMTCDVCVYLAEVAPKPLKLQAEWDLTPQSIQWPADFNLTDG